MMEYDNSVDEMGYRFFRQSLMHNIGTYILLGALLSLNTEHCYDHAKQPFRAPQLTSVNPVVTNLYQKLSEHWNVRFVHVTNYLCWARVRFHQCKCAVSNCSVTIHRSAPGIWGIKVLWLKIMPEYCKRFQEQVHIRLTDWPVLKHFATSLPACPRFCSSRRTQALPQVNPLISWSVAYRC